SVFHLPLSLPGKNDSSSSPYQPPNILFLALSLTLTLPPLDSLSFIVGPFPSDYHLPHRFDFAMTPGLFSFRNFSQSIFPCFHQELLRCLSLDNIQFTATRFPHNQCQFCVHRCCCKLRRCNCSEIATAAVSNLPPTRHHASAMRNFFTPSVVVMLSIPSMLGMHNMLFKVHRLHFFIPTWWTGQYYHHIQAFINDFS
ncbi:unnamed protein product, partial [Linum tenue]